MKFILGFFLLGMVTVAHASDQSLNVDPSATTFIINLPSNPTTGYKWSVVNYDKNLLTLSGTKYKAAKIGLIGSGGQTFYTFTLNKGKSYPAQTILSFQYARPWEQNEGSVKNITVTFKK